MFYKARMFWAFLLSLVIGASTVLQGGLNRQIAVQWGVAGAVLFNTLFYAVASVALFWAAKKYPQFVPDLFHVRGGLHNFSWWYLVPGLCGFLIVAGAPIVIAKIGAVRFMVGLVAAQMIVSLLWDIFVEKIAVTPLRLAGVALAFVSVLLVSSKN